MKACRSLSSKKNGLKLCTAPVPIVGPIMHCELFHHQQYRHHPYQRCYR
jgi:hypothetical protein